MVKFWSHLVDVEVVDYSRWLPGFLNRQIILLLSTRGVPDEAFLQLQQQAMELVECLVGDDRAAALRALNQASMLKIPCGAASCLVFEPGRCMQLHASFLNLADAWSPHDQCQEMVLLKNA